MTTTNTPDAVGDLCARWRRRSLADGWSFAEDWAVPAVALLARAVTTAAELDAHARALGAARAHAGVGIVEGLRDLAVLFTVHGTDTPMGAVLAFTGGWAGVHDLLEPPAARAGMSGLAHVEDFVARSTDVADGMRRALAGERPVVVAVDGRTGVLGNLRRWERDILLGEAVRLAFPPDAPTGYRDGVALALTWTSSVMDPPELADGVAALRETLADWARRRHGILRDPVRVVCTFAPLHPAGALRSVVERSVR